MILRSGGDLRLQLRMRFFCRPWQQRWQEICTLRYHGGGLAPSQRSEREREIEREIERGDARNVFDRPPASA